MKKKLFYTFVFVAILSPALTEKAGAQNRIIEEYTVMYWLRR